jgi:hypothetical protein
MRVNQGQELVIGGYTSSLKNFDALVIGYYENTQLMYAARTRNGASRCCALASIPLPPFPAIEARGRIHARRLSATVCEIRLKRWCASVPGNGRPCGELISAGGGTRHAPLLRSRAGPDALLA